jgi:hypothetical protein
MSIFLWQHPNLHPSQQMISSDLLAKKGSAMDLPLKVIDLVTTQAN